MILCDVSVLLSAGMSESPHHEVCLARLEEVLEADGFAVSELILAAVVRIATNPRVWKKPASQSRIPLRNPRSPSKATPVLL